MAHNQPHKKRKTGKIVLAVLLVVVLLATAVFFVYTSIYYAADNTVPPLVAAAAVDVVDTGGYILCGDAQSTGTGYIFYPGAKVQAEAYLPYLTALCESTGALCAVVKPAFRLAILSPGAATDVMRDHPGIQNWVVGGHSLGGVVAAGFAKDNAATVSGLVLLAAYPNADLSGTGLRAVSITGSEDEVLNREAYEEAKPKLPADTLYIRIPGANHSQFGSYGHQGGDGAATITAEEQRRAVVAETAALLV